MEAVPTEAFGHEALVRRMLAHPMLARLDSAALQLLASTSRLVRFRGGRLVIRQGDPPLPFCLLSGSTRVFHRSGDKEVVVKLFRAPAFGGEMEALCKRNYLVNMRTLEPSELLLMRPDVFERLVHTQPAFAAALAVDLSARLFIATSNERALAFADVDSRLADMLLDYAHLCGVEEPGGIRLTLPLSQRSLARDLAVSRKAICESIQRLKKLGIVRKSGTRYLIINAKALAERSGGGLGVYYRLSEAMRDGTLGPP